MCEAKVVVGVCRFSSSPSFLLLEANSPPRSLRRHLGPPPSLYPGVLAAGE
jgi:hypothetical protein